MIPALFPPPLGHSRSASPERWVRTRCFGAFGLLAVRDAYKAHPVGQLSPLFSSFPSCNKDLAHPITMALRLATLVSVFLSLWAVALAAAPKTDYDVIIVGGGPSGLSALSGVSRVRRTGLLFDNQHYRNAPTRDMHDVIGNDGEIDTVPCRAFLSANIA